MFKRKKNKEKQKRNKKPLAERIIGFIFIGLIVAYFGYSIVILMKDTIVGLGNDFGNLNSSITTLSNKTIDKTKLIFNKNISGEDLSGFYAKTGSNGANLNTFTSGNFDYTKYAKESLNFDGSFALNGNELGVFMNNVVSGEELSLIDKFLEIEIKSIENSSIFYLNSIAKIDLSILDSVSSEKVGEIYLKTESQVSIVGYGLIVHSSVVRVNELDDGDNDEIIEDLDMLLINENYDTNTTNYVTYEIKNFLKEFRKKTNCAISMSNNQIVFSK